ncbi:kinase-like domain-containing protein [Irpex rosettiformis]|uniref:Kinase-like domain-containing protein n=1 Tax=Irpex rosettiformis TaxID=378272 RepID=A0ACB8UIV2_9APHY|nr:kinase-like domain-containing protein [Irpex rosettiformis]
MPDLSTPVDLLAFLNNGVFASQSATPVSGGLGNYTFRLALKTPYQGHHTAILKHGKPYLPGMESMAFDLERQRFEVEAMRYTKSIIQESALVTVPEIYLLDSDAGIIIMEDCAVSGSDTYTLTLKEYLLRTEGTRPSPPTKDIAHDIGVALGLFLATLHNESQNNTDILDKFDKNQQGRNLSAWVTYGRLHSTLSGEDTLPPLSDPPFEVSAADLEKIDRVGKKAQDLIRTSREALVHGDFWPGNMLVRFKPTSERHDEVEKIYLVDWELVKPGSRGVEVGQLLGEVHQTSRFCEVNAPSAEALGEGFLETYRKKVENEAKEVDLEQVAAAASVHIGAHLVIWTPRIWTSVEKEKIRGVVSDGVGFLVNSDSRDSLKKSPVGPLFTTLSPS